MAVDVYRILHIAGVFLVLIALGGIAVHMINGGTREFKARKGLAAIHGTGLLLVLVAGFGMLAKLGYGFPAWAIAKMVIWLILGVIPAVFYRKPASAKPILGLVYVLACVAVYLCLYKPF